MPEGRSVLGAGFLLPSMLGSREVMDNARRAIEAIAVGFVGAGCCHR
jgi:hypothetical protein